MTKNKKVLLLFISTLLFILPGCKFLSNTAIGRFYHNLTSHYNIYFNANEIMKTVIKNTENAHIDDYNSILDIYQFGNDDILKKNTSQVDNVLKKCNKILEKHPSSKWIPDAYLLVGMAYFYKGDYYAALETFQYIQTKYKNTTIGYKSMLWICLCDLKIAKYSEAQAQLSLVKSEENFPAKLKKEYLLTSAFVNIRLENYGSAIESLKNAILKEHRRNFKTRYIFILAQLYQKTWKLDEAAKLYTTVIKRNPNYDMAFNAKIDLSRCYNIEEEKNVKYIRNTLLKMLKDDKNIQYQDQIYFELALLESKVGNQMDMEKYLKLSLEKSKGNQNQKALAFLMLGNFYYDHSNYLLAKNYFDSCSSFINESYPDYKRIKERTNILSKLIGNLVIVQTEDSLLYLASLSQTRLDSVIDKSFKLEQKMIKEKKEKEQEAKRNEEQENTFNREVLRNRELTPGGQTLTPSGWYFSNPQTVSMGISEFNLKWGKRKLEDDWRRKKKNTALSSTDNENENEKAQDSSGNVEQKIVLTDDDLKTIKERIKNVPPEKQKYYKDIPFTQKQKEISRNKVLNSLYAAANIYLDDLKDTAKAIETYEKVLERFPNSKYESEIHYILYNLYSKQNKKDKAELHRKIIAEKFPDSEYALLITDPDYFTKRLKTQNTQAKIYYDTIYDLFIQGKCHALIDSVTKAKKDLGYSSYYPKMEYLKIICVGKDTTKAAFISMLNAFIKKYKSNDVIHHAQNLVNYLEESDTSKGNTKKTTTTNNSPYSFNPRSLHYFIVTVPSKDMQTARTSFSNYNTEFHELEELTVSSVVFSSEIQLLIVKEFPSFDEATKYIKEVSKDDNLRKKVELKQENMFIISSQNLSVLMNLKDLEQYNDFYKSNYK